MNDTSHKIGLEIKNQIIDGGDQTLHGPANWSRWDIRLADSYVKGDVGVVVSVTFAGKEWLAHFQRITEVRNSKARENEVKASASRLDSNITDADKSCEQSMVLIGNVEFVEYPEIVTLPSQVRFGSSNSILRSVPHSVYLSSKRGFVNCVAVKDREHRPFRDRVSGHLNKATCEVIERASEVVDNVASDQRNTRIDWVDPGHKKSIAAFVSGLKVRLGTNSVGLTFDESVFNEFQILEVCIGPFDFSSY